MVRRLDMHKTQGIEHLFPTGVSKRKTARTLGIDRKSVDRHLADIQSKGAICQEAPIGEAPTGSDALKGAKAVTGSEADNKVEETVQECMGVLVHRQVEFTTL
jgi:hypothetical protein